MILMAPMVVVLCLGAWFVNRTPKAIIPAALMFGVAALGVVPVHAFDELKSATTGFYVLLFLVSAAGAGAIFFVLALFGESMFGWCYVIFLGTSFAFFLPTIAVKLHAALG